MPYVAAYDDEVAHSMRKVSVCVFGHIQAVAPGLCCRPLMTVMPQPRKIQSLGFASGRGEPSPSTTPTVYLTMLKRFSSLILALVIGSSVFVGTSRLEDEHVCEMAGMEAMPGMETMPCCKKNQNAAVESESGPPEQCCFNIPRETGSRGTTFNLRAPTFSIAVTHPAVAQSPLAVPKPYESSYTPQVFLPNLQASYIRNLSILI
jgi:hypothetical protein